MFDTHCRSIVQPLMEKGADFFVRRGIDANGVTKIALIFGVLSSVFIILDIKILSIICLWISGYLDAVDGTIARKTRTQSKLGTLMDICFDRVVEILIIIGIGYRYTHLSFSLLILASTIIISMTVFLTTGALSDEKSEKSFYYQAGLMERTEGFLMLSLMIIFGENSRIIILLFSLLIVITIFQRVNEAKKLLN